MKKRKSADLFNDFMAIVRRLRKDCPWDRVQTHRSLRQSLLEEAYEVLDAVTAGNRAALREELGDLLLHVAMHSVIAEERKRFDIDDVLRDIHQKLIRRHPHVFGRTRLRTSSEVRAHWESLKMKEGRTSVLDGVPRTLPALLKARRLQERAAKVGFDWKKKADVWKKVTEELRELRTAESRKQRRNIEEEFGDVLFSLVNYSRFIGIHPELALMKTADKFARRFKAIERRLEQRKIAPDEAGLPLLDRLWSEEKRRHG